MATSVLDLFTTAARQAIETGQQYAQSVREVAQANERDSTKLLDIISTAAGADTVLATEAQNNQMAVQAAKERARQAAGGEEKMLQGIQEVVAGTEQVKAKTAEVVRKRNRSILDLVSDPIGTLKDIVTLEQSETELQGAVLTTGNAALGVTQRYTALQQGFKEAEDMKIVANAATLDASAKKIAAIRDEALVKAQIEGRKYNLVGMQTVQQMRVQEVELLQKAISVGNAEEQLKLTKNAQALSAERLRLDKIQVQQQTAARQEAADEITLVSNAIKQGMSVAGLSVPESTLLKVHARQAITNPNSDAAKYMAIGMRNMSIGANSNMLGANAAESYGLIESLDVRVPPQMQASVQILRDAAALVKVDRKANPAAWNAELNKKAGEIIANEFANPTVGGVADFGPNLATYIQSTPALMQLPVTQKLIAPLLQTGQSIADPSALMRLGISAVTKGTITSSELAGGMSAIYRQAALMHGEATRIRDLGIIPPKLGMMYNAKLDTGTFGRDKVDLTNNSELGRWIAKAIAEQTRIGFGRSAGVN